MIITLLRKPLEGSVAENTLKHGCGAINIDDTRIGTGHHLPLGKVTSKRLAGDGGLGAGSGREGKRENFTPRFADGRWPANFILIGDCSVKELDRQSGRVKGWSSQNHNTFNPYQGNSFHNSSTQRQGYKEGYNDDGGASRFFKQFNTKDDQ
jgi:site-specific DNA-methyltransferase (adenine-specific)